MAKKLTPNQLKVLRDLAERYHNNDLQSRVLPVDKRTARGMTTLERPFIKLSFPIAKTDYYLITETGLNYLAALDAQPAIGTAQAAGYTYPELLDKYFPGEPEEPKQPSVNEAKPSTPVSPVLNNALNVLSGENHRWVEVKPEQRIAEVFSLLDDAGVRDGNLMSITDRVKVLVQERDKLLRSEDAYHQENERYARALSKILSALMVAQPMNDLIDEIHAIVTEALADEKPKPKTTRHYVTVMPSIGDKVRIRKGAGQDTDYLINAQKLGTVGVIVGFDELEVKVEFASSEEDTWMLAFSELEIVELNPHARPALED